MLWTQWRERGGWPRQGSIRIRLAGARSSFDPAGSNLTTACQSGPRGDLCGAFPSEERFTGKAKLRIGRVLLTTLMTDHLGHKEMMTHDPAVIQCPEPGSPEVFFGTGLRARICR